MPSTTQPSLNAYHFDRLLVLLLKINEPVSSNIRVSVNGIEVPNPLVESLANSGNDCLLIGTLDELPEIRQATVVLTDAGGHEIAHSEMQNVPALSERNLVSVPLSARHRIYAALLDNSFKNIPGLSPALMHGIACSIARTDVFAVQTSERNAYFRLPWPTDSSSGQSTMQIGISLPGNIRLTRKAQSLCSDGWLHVSMTLSAKASKDTVFFLPDGQSSSIPVRVLKASVCSDAVSFSRAVLNPYKGNRNVLSTFLTHCGYTIPEAPAALEPITAYTGNIDLVMLQPHSTRIFGWVWNKSQPDQTVHARIVSGNRTIATVAAGVFRQNLLDQGIGDGRHAFEATVDRPLSQADARGLRLAPAEVQKIVPPIGDCVVKRLFDVGAVDNIQSDTIIGWIHPAIGGNEPCLVEAYVGDQWLGSALANQFRGDVAQHFQTTGFLGFTLSLSRPLRVEDLAHLRILSANCGTALKINSAVLAQTHANLSDTGRANDAPDYQSSLEHIGEIVSGWAFDKNAPGHRLILDAFIDGIYINSVTADGARPDVSAEFSTDGFCGFGFSFPTGLALSGSATLDLRYRHTGESLPDMPQTILLGVPGRPNQPAREEPKADVDATMMRPYSPPPDCATSWQRQPTVAIIVLNRNGASYLQEMFRTFFSVNTYEQFEFIVIDHGSTDQSRWVALDWAKKMPVRLINRRLNCSYAESNNFAASLTDAEYLFLLNNDITFLDDALGSLVNYFIDPTIGIVGMKLLSPKPPVKQKTGAALQMLADVPEDAQSGETKDGKHGELTLTPALASAYLCCIYEEWMQDWKRQHAQLLGYAPADRAGQQYQVQHMGVKFETTQPHRAFLPFEIPYHPKLKFIDHSAWEVPAVTAGAFVIRREDFETLGGFHEGYFYGFEDIDFCLRAQQTFNKKILCANNIVAFHDRSASRTHHTPYEKRIAEKNKTTVEHRTGPFFRGLMNEGILDDSEFWRGRPFRVAFAVSDNAIDSEAGDYFTAFELGQALYQQYGWEIHYLNPDEWYNLKAFDVLVALVHGYDPRKIETANPFLLKIVWMRNWFEGWLGLPSTILFDQIWASSNKAVEKFSEAYKRPIYLIRIATNEQRFSNRPVNSKWASDYCFTGSFFKSPRQLISDIDPEALAYKFKIFGHNWEQMPFLNKYLGGPLPYHKLPAVYGSTRIVLDDANHTVKEWGSVNSRVFDALAAGALVLTNGQIGAEEVFGEDLPVFDNKAELTSLLETYLEDEEVRKSLVKKLRAEVLRKHTYRHRATEVRNAIEAALRFGRCSIVSTKQTDHLGVKQLRNYVYEAAGSAGLLPRIDGGSPLDQTARYGDDLAIVIASGFEDAPPLSDFTHATARVLVLLCRLDQISRAYSAAFNIIITATQHEAEAIQRQPEQTVFTLDEAALLANSEGGLRFERALAERLAATLSQRIMPAVTEWLTEHLPSLSTIPDPKVTPFPATDAGVASSAPQHIAYVLWDFPALSQTFVLSELRWLKARGYAVTVYYKIKPDKPATLDFSIDAYPVSDPEDLANHLTLHKHTVLHCHFAYPAMTQLAYPAAKRTQLPFTVMVHAVDIFHYVNQNRNRLRAISNDALCRKVFTLGDFHRNFLVSRGVPAGKIALIGQSAVLPTFNHDDAAATHRLYAPKHIIGSLSRFTEKKGLSVLIDAAVDLPDFEIRLYGYGPLQDKLKRQIAALNVCNVRLMGPIEQAEALESALNEIDVFVAPCVRTADGDMDGIPTVLLEAMAFGIPVIATRVSGIPDLIRHGVNGFLVDAQDPQGLARSIKGVAGMNPERLRRILSNARTEVNKRYGVDKTLPAMLDVWNGETLDIFLVTFDRPGYHTPAETKDTIHRLYKYTSTEFRLTIVDNDSDEAFLTDIESLISDKPNAELIRLDENRMCGPASNVAMAQGHSRYMVYLCSKEGFVLKHGWERECIEYMEQNRDVGMAGNLIYSPKYYNAETYRQQDWFQHFREKAFIDQNPDKRFVHVQGGFFILRRQAYEQCGGFNEAIPQGGMDIEYSYHLESQGWKLGSLPNTKIITTLTRPTLQASCDENTIVAHPLTVRQAQKLDTVVLRQTKQCNVCGWSGKAFVAGDACPNCGSHPFDRTLERYLADSTLIYRGLRCFAVMRGNALNGELARFFELNAYRTSDASSCEGLVKEWAEAIRSKSIDILIVDHLHWTKPNLDRLYPELLSFIRQGGRLFIGENAYIPEGARFGLSANTIARLDSIRLASGLKDIGRTIKIQYASEVVQYDWQDVFEVALHDAVIPSAVNYQEDVANR